MSRHGHQAEGSCWVATEVFLVATELVFSSVYVAIGVLPVSRQCFVLCCDNVMIEGPLLRPTTEAMRSRS